MQQHDPHEPRNSQDQDELDSDEPRSEQDSGPWHPAHGRTMRVLSWLVLAGIALVVVLMVAVTIYELTR